MKKRRKRIFLSHLRGHDTDPLSGMANLFDVAMVFAVALMIAIVLHFKMTDFLTKENFTIVKNPGKNDMEIIIKEGKKITKYKSTKTTGSGKGKRIGTAYELEDGNIIYIPE